MQTYNRADVALGPCPDGGYYLIVAKKPPKAFTGIPWGTGDVLVRTLKRLKAARQSWTLLPEEQDVDQVEDLYLMRHAN